jgi:23S rRNA (uracil1939-C5)-methyltransferase
MNDNPTATPRCPHFGTCGGCQYQDIAYTEQLRLKQTQLADLLQQAGIAAPQDITLHAAEPYGYRNRIRLRLVTIDGQLRFGYNRANTTDFLPITTCPISAPVLIETAAALLTLAPLDRDAAHWLNATAELELFCDSTLTRVQMTLLCAPRTKAPQGSLDRMLHALQAIAPQVTGLAAIAADPRSGPTGRTLAEAGTPGILYRVQDIDYWITRGGFFQINRFLIETLVRLVTTHEGQPRSGQLAWDLFAGVGLFSRVLARSFDRITAVEANSTAASDLRASLTKLGPQHTTVEATTLDFLRKAIPQRERPELIVLDPPRAGAGSEACELLNRLTPQTLVYVSCDPTTLARDLAILQPRYRITQLHLVDLFPQTQHLETVAILEKKE